MRVDAVNAFFEAGLAIFLTLNISRLLKDKTVKGVSLAPTAFYMIWGFWNLYYYPHLGQWYSFTAGCEVVVTNAAWLVLAIHYRRKS